MSKIDDFFLGYLIKSVSKENILSCVSTFKENKKISIMICFSINRYC